MIKAIIYESNSGFTKQYAYHFATKTGLPIYTLKEAKKKLNKGDKIIFFSWVNAEKVYKIKKAKRYNIEYAVAVGLTLYNENYIDTIKKNSSFDKIYYLEGGIRWRMLSPMQRILMKILLKIMKRKKKKNQLTEEELITLDRFNLGYEKINLDSLDILINWYNERNNFVA